MSPREEIDAALRWIRDGAPERDVSTGEGWRLDWLDFDVRRRFEKAKALAFATVVLRLLDARSYGSDEEARAAVCAALAENGHVQLAERVHGLAHLHHLASGVLES